MPRDRRIAGESSSAQSSSSSSWSSRAWYLACAVMVVQSCYVVLLLNHYSLDTGSLTLDASSMVVPSLLGSGLSVTSHSSNHDDDNRDDDDFALAQDESYNFFTDIRRAHWRRVQALHRQMPHHLDAAHDKVAAFYFRPRGYWQNNWEPDFAGCTAPRMVGPLRDGHKWVCDPHRLADAEQDCLVYSLGSNGDFSFETALLDLAPHCHIHVFDMATNYGRRAQTYPHIHYHAYGLKPSYITDPALLGGKGALPPRGDFRTLPEIIDTLGHGGRTIAIMKVDIEGGEWTTFRDWLAVQETTTPHSRVMIQQLLVEVHDAPPVANDFMAALHDAGYAMFHKEPNVQFAGGDCVEFAWIKLRPSFFSGATATGGQPVQHSAQALQHAQQHAQEYQENRQKSEHDYGREMRLTGVI